MNEKVFNGELPKILVSWITDNMMEKYRIMFPEKILGKYCLYRGQEDIGETYILFNKQAENLHSLLERIIVHEMIHLKTVMIDFQNGTSLGEKDSCCPGLYGCHRGLFKVIADDVLLKHGYDVWLHERDLTALGWKNVHF